MESYASAAALVDGSVRSVRRWVDDYDGHAEFEESARGMHPHKGWALSDPAARAIFESWCRENRQKKGEPNLTAEAVAKWWTKEGNVLVRKWHFEAKEEEEMTICPLKDVPTTISV